MHSSTLALACLLGCCALASARPQDKSSEGSAEGRHGHHGPGRGHHHGPPPFGGPLGPIMDKLSKEQRLAARDLFRANRDKPRADFKKAMDEFVAQLPEELQKEVREHKAEHEKRKQADAEKVQKLSAKAQQLYKELQAVHEDDSLTFKQGMKKAHELSKAAGKEVGCGVNVGSSEKHLQFPRPANK